MRHRDDVGLKQSLNDWPEGNQATKYLRSVLRNAIIDKDFACTKILLARGVDVNSVYMKGSMLGWACKSSSSIAMIMLLLDHGADPNVDSIRGGGSLIAQAAFGGKARLVRVLADAGANINPDCPVEKSPLYKAIRGGSAATAKYLLEKGADVKDIGVRFFAGEAGLTPFSEAKSVVLGELLLDWGTERGMDWALQ